MSRERAELRVKYVADDLDLAQDDSIICDVCRSVSFVTVLQSKSKVQSVIAVFCVGVSQFFHEILRDSANIWKPDNNY